MKSINKVTPQNKEQLDLLLTTFHGTLGEVKARGDKLAQLNLEAKEKIKEVENYNQNILQSLTSGVITFDTKGKVTTLNEAAQNILGIKEREIKNMSYQEIFRAYPEFSALWKEAIINSRVYNRKEFSFPFLGGESTWIGVRTSLLRDNLDRVLGVIFLISDLTSVKRLEETMKTKERLASLGEMAAGIAHEFRNSLGAIQGYIKLIQKKSSNESGIAEFTKQVILEIYKFEEIMKKFLDFVRPSKLNFSLYDLNQLVKESLACLAEEIRQKKINITLELQDNLPKISIDYLLIRQALINMILNAIQASSEEERVVINILQTKEFQVVEVIDYGADIPLDIKDKIFTPFFTTKINGTGLGLSITQKIIADHSGFVEVDSDREKGTAFRVYLPLVTALSQHYQEI
ncbi:MAG: ATP-binding protein [bacterium]